MFAHVIFDLDGTLIDSCDGIASALRAAVLDVLPDAEVPPLRERIGPPMSQIVRRLLPDADEALRARVVAGFRARYDDEGWRGSTAYPGAAQTLRALARRGVGCFVVTNKPRLPTANILRELGLAEFFAEVVCPDCRRPPYSRKAEAVAALIERHRLDRAASLLVGDSDDDWRAARENQVAFALAAYGYGAGPHLRDAAPAAVLPELTALLRLWGEPAARG